VPSFRSADEFRVVMDRTLELMSSDPTMGPKLRDADTPQRWEFPDFDLVVNLAAADDGDSRHNLVWEWSDDVPWEPEVRMQMDSDVANRYFQGEENIAMAIARRRIKTSGNVKKALALVPVTKPVFELYKSMCRAEYPHLVVEKS
jgi:SCP-2 sterol transfer family